MMPTGDTRGKWRTSVLMGAAILFGLGAFACADSRPGRILFELATLDRGGIWHGVVLLLALFLVVHLACATYLKRSKTERKSVEEMGDLPLRTVEALALALEAKDPGAGDGLRRVPAYAVELGAAMHLPDSQREALRVAASLRDIGKLSVPDYIVSKPGDPTPAEFDKMKTHAAVGAAILEQAGFPGTVTAIVRSHHERWDGRGYPDGLKGDAIPIGARILAAAECFAALISNRPSPAPDEARDALSKLAGTSLDPAVVRMLQRKCAPWAAAGGRSGRGLLRSACAPLDRSAGNPHECLASIASAREEMQVLFDLTHDLGNSANPEEILASVASRLKRLVDYDAVAISIRRDAHLIPEYVSGESFRLLSSLEIPVGQGLSGWVAETGEPILNGDPTLDFKCSPDTERSSKLGSAACVALTGVAAPIGVMTLYRSGTKAFTADQLRVLLAVASRVSPTIENALKFRQAQKHATIDYLTKLPNARSLFPRLDSELARARRTLEPVAVVVGDLDNFKQVNREYGRAEANKVLQAVADSLREGCREYDYVARMSGDEFVLIFPANDMTSIRQRLADFREIGARSRCGLPAMKGLRMSLGEAFFPEDCDNAEHLLAEAGRRMHEAKRMFRTLISSASVAVREVPG